MSAMAEFVGLRPYGGFDLIMADNPWRFDLYSAAGEAKAPQAHYDCMSLDDLAALPVEAVAAKDCLLWLWALNPMLPQALRIMDAWGFEFKTAGTWVKRTKHGKDCFGTGYVLRMSRSLSGRGGRRRRRAPPGQRSPAMTTGSIRMARLGLPVPSRSRQRRASTAGSRMRLLRPQRD